MYRKIKFHPLYFYLILILLVIGFTACHHKHKTSENSNLINEMPLPDVNKTYYSPQSYQKVDVGESDNIYNVIEQMPQFPGGDEELMNFISKNLIYPSGALRDGIQGKVICRCVITSTGKVKNPEVMRSLDPPCDREALRVIKLLPSFIPGKQNGVNVNVWYTLPITFKLN